MSKPAVYPKLLEIRESKNLSLRANPFLREETDLRNYQVQMVMHLLMLNKMVVGDDVGLGKTLELMTAYSFFLEKNPEVTLLWLGPKTSLYQIENEFKKFTTGISTYVVRGKNKDDLKPHCRTGYMKKYKHNSTYCRVCDFEKECKEETEALKGLRGCSAKEFRKFKYEQFKKKGTNVLILNYNLALMEHKTIIENAQPYIVVFDEATAFKNYRSKTWAVCKEITDASEKAWAATATIIKNRLEEAYSIYKCILPGLLGGVVNFQNNFCIIRRMNLPKSRRKIPIIVGHKNINKFREIIDPYFLGRAARKVGIELPDLVSKEIELELTSVQKEKYEEALDGLLETDQGEIKTVTKLTAITYCQQIANSPYLVGVEGPSCKEEALFDLLENEFLGQKIIFFTRFRKWIDRLELLMQEKKMNPLRITGKESTLEREENRQKFQDSSDHNLILINTAGGQALNLQSARVLIWGDLILSYGDVLQVIGRMIRFGSIHKKVLSVHLIAQDTVDEHTFKIVFPKKKLFEQLLGKRHEGLLEFNEYGDSEVSGIFSALLQDASNNAKKKKKSS